ncbi:MAG TPA: DUF503 domain-containing protein [Vicinamibacteria bacterium]|nr:DUF503 domain-containing protein [Vicinamibacteria bacterium]
MVVGLLMLELHFPGARSLKDKRQALRSLEERIRHRFNVSVAEVEHQDLWQRSRLAVVSVNTDHAHLESTLDSVAGEAGHARNVLLVDSHVEML